MSKKTSPKVILIHGFGGKPNGGWRPWLMGELGKHLDVFAVSLAMPNPDTPKKKDWVHVIQKEVASPDMGTVLVGHSLGVPAILRYLETLPKGKKILGAVLVSGPVHSPEGKEYSVIKNFFTGGFDFKKIRSSCANFVIIHGDNDAVVSMSEAYELSGELNAPIHAIKNGGHLNGSSGWYELPQAFAEIKKMFKH